MHQIFNYLTYVNYDHHISTMDKNKTVDRMLMLSIQIMPILSGLAWSIFWCKTFIIYNNLKSSAQPPIIKHILTCNKMLHWMIIILSGHWVLHWSVMYVNNPLGVHLHVWLFVDCTGHCNEKQIETETTHKENGCLPISLCLK